MKIKHISHLESNSTEKLFGFMPDGEQVNFFELKNKKGMQLCVINYGATLTSLKVPLINGELVDVVLGFDNLKSYIDSFDLESAPYLGATVGRFAGRINEASFVLNDKRVDLSKNNNGNSLHGGDKGFSQVVWKAQKVSKGKNPSVTFSYLSPNNEENYPGDLMVELKYTLSEANELIVEYVASTSEDTVVNLTHHSYFNLEGHKFNVVDQEMIVNSVKTLHIANDNVPTGWFLNVANCPFDFSLPRKCPEKIDNTYVLDKKEEFAASLFSKKNNLKMSVHTNQPAVHIYVGGNCFDAIKGKDNADYNATSGICFETQNFPDAPNHEHFPSAVLRKGEIYHHKSIYKFQSFKK
jgi:aldose 1-epimerase